MIAPVVVPTANFPDTSSIENVSPPVALDTLTEPTAVPMATFSAISNEGVLFVNAGGLALLLLEDFGSSLLLEEGGGETSLLDDCVGVSEDVTEASSLDDSTCSLLEDFSSGSTSLLLEDCFSLELDALLLDDPSTGSGVFDELLETFSLLLDETEELDSSRLSSLWMTEEDDSGSSTTAT